MFMSRRTECSQSQRGFAALLFLFFVLSLGIYVMTALAQRLEYRTAVSDGKKMSSDIASIISSWEESMNYACSSGNIPTHMTINSLALKPSYFDYSRYSFRYTSPPNSSVVVEASAENVVLGSVLASVSKEIEREHVKAQIVIENVSNQRIRVTATRLTKTSQIIFDTFRQNSNASTTSIIIDGLQLYDSNGC